MTEDENDFDARVAAQLASRGVSMHPIERVANPERTRAAQPGLPQPPTSVPYEASGFIARASFPWIGVLGSAQAADHEVSVHLRQDPVTAFRGKVVNEPPLSTLDEIGAASIKTIKLERDTGNAPRREVTTILLADVVAVTVIEKIVEKKS